MKYNGNVAMLPSRTFIIHSAFPVVLVVTQDWDVRDPKAQAVALGMSGADHYDIEGHFIADFLCDTFCKKTLEQIVRHLQQRGIPADCSRCDP